MIKFDFLFSFSSISCYKWDFDKTLDIEGNTGLFYLQSNYRTVAWWKEFTEVSQKHSTLDDQTIFWQHFVRMKNKSISNFDNTSRAIHVGPCQSNLSYSVVQSKHSSTLSEIVMCHVDGCAFSVGALRGIAYSWLRNYIRMHSRQNQLKLISIHANFIRGNELKMGRLKEFGYWIAGIAHQNLNDCMSFREQF